MALHIHRLDAKIHQAFLAEDRRDPLTRDLLQPGDDIVICDNCHIACLLDSWNQIGRCPLCSCAETLPNISPPPKKQIKNSRRDTPPKFEIIESLDNDI